MRLFRRRSTDLADPQLTGLRFDQVRLLNLRFRSFFKNYNLLFHVLN